MHLFELETLINRRSFYFAHNGGSSINGQIKATSFAGGKLSMLSLTFEVLFAFQVLSLSWAVATTS